MDWSARPHLDPPSILSSSRSLLIDQTAELLGVSRRTVYNRIREGRLRTIRTRCGSRRVLVDSIESLLREMVAKTEARGYSPRRCRFR
jgi:excisionase family DNA binding protein